MNSNGKSEKNNLFKSSLRSVSSKPNNNLTPNKNRFQTGATPNKNHTGGRKSNRSNKKFANLEKHMAFDEEGAQKKSPVRYILKLNEMRDIIPNLKIIRNMVILR